MARGVPPARQQGILQTLFSFPLSASLTEFRDCRQQIPGTLYPLHTHQIKSKNNCSALFFFNYHIQGNNSPYCLLAVTISSEPGKVLPPQESAENMVPVMVSGEIELAQEEKINLSPIDTIISHQVK
jgi:hypothetical protein